MTPHKILSEVRCQIQYQYQIKLEMSIISRLKLYMSGCFKTDFVNKGFKHWTSNNHRLLRLDSANLSFNNTLLIYNFINRIAGFFSSLFGVRL